MSIPGLPETQTYQATTDFILKKIETDLLEKVCGEMKLETENKQVRISQILQQSNTEAKKTALESYLDVFNNMNLETAEKIYSFIHKNTNPRINSLTKDLSRMKNNVLKTRYYDNEAKDLTWLSYPIKISESESALRLQSVALSVLSKNCIENKVKEIVYQNKIKSIRTTIINDLKSSFKDVFKQELNFNDVLTDGYINAHRDLDITKFEKTVDDLKIKLNSFKSKEILIDGIKYNFQLKDEDLNPLDNLLKNSSDFIKKFKIKQFINSFNLNVVKAFEELKKTASDAYNIKNIEALIQMKQSLPQDNNFTFIKPYLTQTPIDITNFREILVGLYLEHLKVKEQGIIPTDKEIFQIKLPPEELERQKSIINFLTELAIYLRDNNKLKNYTGIENTQSKHLNNTYIAPILQKYVELTHSIQNLQAMIKKLEDDLPNKEHLRKIDVITAYNFLIDNVSQDESFTELAKANNRYNQLVNFAIIVSSDNLEKSVYLSSDLKELIIRHSKIQDKTIVDYKVMIQDLKDSLKDHYTTQKTKLEKEIEPYTAAIAEHKRQIEKLLEEKKKLERTLGPVAI